MDIFENGPLAEVREKYTDILLAQLLDSSDDFREWFTAYTTSGQEVAEYYGVRCNEANYGRETDLMFGFKGANGDDYLVLIENKIKAQEQPNQLHDYHDRGESYVERGVCDQYLVCLFAPRDWVIPEVKAKVDQLLLYEDVMDRLETLDHDGAEFTLTVLSQSVGGATSSVPDNSHVTEELWREINIESNQDLQSYSITSNHVRCTSSHSDHPDFIIYNIYLAKTGKFGNTNLRTQIIFDEVSRTIPTEIDKQTIKSQFGDAIDQALQQRHPEFRDEYENIRTQNKTVIIKELPHEDMPPFGSDEYYKEVIAEFSKLIKKTHSVIIDLDFQRISQETM